MKTYTTLFEAQKEFDATPAETELQYDGDLLKSDGQFFIAIRGERVGRLDQEVINCHRPTVNTTLSGFFGHIPDHRTKHRFLAWEVCDKHGNDIGSFGKDFQEPSDHEIAVNAYRDAPTLIQKAKALRYLNSWGLHF